MSAVDKITNHQPLYLGSSITWDHDYTDDIESSIQLLVCGPLLASRQYEVMEKEARR